MEKMIAEGHFCAVLDVTTTELADEVADGIYSVGPRRLREAPAHGIPYIVVPGALEMIKCLVAEDTLQPAQKARTLYYHSPSSIAGQWCRNERAGRNFYPAAAAQPSGNDQSHHSGKGLLQCGYARQGIQRPGRQPDFSSMK